MHFNIKRVEKVVLSRKKAKMGKTHCFTCFKMRLHLRWSTTIFSQLPHMRTTISPDLWIVYIPMNRSTCILTLKESKSRVKAQKGKNGQNALFHLLQNAPTPALIYHDFLPTSTHAHNYITRSLDSLHPNEQVYMHFNIKRVEKVVLRRKKAKMGKTHCFTCFNMRLHLRWSTTTFSQLPDMRTTTSPDLWIVYIPMNRSTCILTLKQSKSRVKAQRGKNGQNALFHLLQNAPTPALIYHDFLPTSTHAHNYISRSLDSLHPNEQVYMHFNIKRVEKVVLRRKKAKMGKTHCFTCFKMRLHLRWSTTIFSQLPHMRTTISPDLWIVYIPMNRSTCILTLKESKKSS